MITVETTPNAVLWERIRTDGARDLRSCSVHTLAIVAGCHYRQAAEVYASLGRKPNRGTKWSQSHEAYWKMGLRLTEMSDRYDEEVLRIFRLHRTLDFTPYRRHPVTINQACKALPSHGRFLIRSTSHVSAFIDGVHYCTAGMPRKRVRSVWMVSRRANN